MIRTNKELFDYIIRLNHSDSDELFSEHVYNPSQLILVQEKKVFSVSIIKSGIVKCYVATDTGKTFIQEFFGTGELFGEIEIIDNSYSLSTIEAITEVVVYNINKDNFLKLLTKDKEFNLLLLKALTAKLKYKAIRHAYNQSHTVESNLSRLRKDFPELELVIPKQDIAAYLGITLRGLNRAIKNLKENNNSV